MVGYQIPHKVLKTRVKSVQSSTLKLGGHLTRHISHRDLTNINCMLVSFTISKELMSNPESSLDLVGLL